MRGFLEGGKRIAYGARALNEGGWQSIPRVVFPGGALIGDAAGFLNVPKIKGTHTAMKTRHAGGRGDRRGPGLGREAAGAGQSYPRLHRAFLGGQELKSVRNVRPGFAKMGFWGGMAAAALDTYVFRGSAPWTMTHHPDHETLRDAAEAPRIAYPKPDGKLTFDRLSSVFLSNTNHEENQPRAPRAEGPGPVEERELGQVPLAREPLLPGRGLRGGGAGGRARAARQPDPQATGAGRRGAGRRRARGW